MKMIKVEKKQISQFEALYFRVEDGVVAEWLPSGCSSDMAYHKSGEPQEW